MVVRRCILLVVLAVLGVSPADGAPVKLKKVTWTIDGRAREALVHVPAGGERKPLIFAWHGHGGTAAFAARKFAFHTLWPEAVVVYPQGLPTPAPLVDPEGKRSGWQKFIGDQSDRDLKFFDAMLATCLADYQVDGARVFSAGHSNGGYFTYVLAAARGDKLAALAPVAATVNLRDLKRLKAKPVLHVAGKEDRLVRFAAQERTINLWRKLNQCNPEGKPTGKNCTEYRSKDGPPVVAFIHPGGHEVPEGAADQIIAFFKQNDQKQDDPSR